MLENQRVGWVRPGRICRAMFVLGAEWEEEEILEWADDPSYQRIMGS